jgi:hypothetical protein
VYEKKNGMKLQKSILGIIVTGIYLALALSALTFHLYSVKMNPGDSGESAIVMVPFCVPWIYFVPKAVAYSRWWSYGAYFYYLFSAGVNALILYCLSGGCYLGREKTHES